MHSQRWNNDDDDDAGRRGWASHGPLAVPVMNDDTPAAFQPPSQPYGFATDAAAGYSQQRPAFAAAASHTQYGHRRPQQPPSSQFGPQQSFAEGYGSSGVAHNKSARRGRGVMLAGSVAPFPCQLHVDGGLYPSSSARSGPDSDTMEHHARLTIRPAGSTDEGTTSDDATAPSLCVPCAMTHWRRSDSTSATHDGDLDAFVLDAVCCAANLLAADDVRTLLPQWTVRRLAILMAETLPAAVAAAINRAGSDDADDRPSAASRQHIPAAERCTLVHVGRVVASTTAACGLDADPDLSWALREMASSLAQGVDASLADAEEAAQALHLLQKQDLARRPPAAGAARGAAGLAAKVWADVAVGLMMPVDSKSAHSSETPDIVMHRPDPSAADAGLFFAFFAGTSDDGQPAPGAAVCRGLFAFMSSDGVLDASAGTSPQVAVLPHLQWLQRLVQAITLHVTSLLQSPWLGMQAPVALVALGSEQPFAAYVQNGVVSRALRAAGPHYGDALGRYTSPSVTPAFDGDLSAAACAVEAALTYDSLVARTFVSASRLLTVTAAASRTDEPAASSGGAHDSHQHTQQSRTAREQRSLAGHLAQLLVALAGLFRKSDGAPVLLMEEAAEELSSQGRGDWTGGAVSHGCVAAMTEAIRAVLSTPQRAPWLGDTPAACDLLDACELLALADSSGAVEASITEAVAQIAATALHGIAAASAVPSQQQQAAQPPSERAVEATVRLVAYTAARVFDVSSSASPPSQRGMVALAHPGDGGHASSTDAAWVPYAVTGMLLIANTAAEWVASLAAAPESRGFHCLTGLAAIAASAYAETAEATRFAALLESHADLELVAKLATSALNVGVRLRPEHLLVGSVRRWLQPLESLTATKSTLARVVDCVERRELRGVSRTMWKLLEDGILDPASVTVLTACPERCDAIAAALRIAVRLTVVGARPQRQAGEATTDASQSGGPTPQLVRAVKRLLFPWLSSLLQQLPSALAMQHNTSSDGGFQRLLAASVHPVAVCLRHLSSPSHHDDSSGDGTAEHEKMVGTGRTEDTVRGVPQSLAHFVPQDVLNALLHGIGASATAARATGTAVMSSQTVADVVNVATATLASYASGAARHGRRLPLLASFLMAEMRPHPGAADPHNVSCPVDGNHLVVDEPPLSLCFRLFAVFIAGALNDMATHEHGGTTTSRQQNMPGKLAHRFGEALTLIDAVAHIDAACAVELCTHPDSWPSSTGGRRLGFAGALCRALSAATHLFQRMSSSATLHTWNAHTLPSALSVSWLVEHRLGDVSAAQECLATLAAGLGVPGGATSSNGHHHPSASRLPADVRGLGLPMAVVTWLAGTSAWARVAAIALGERALDLARDPGGAARAPVSARGDDDDAGGGQRDSDDDAAEGDAHDDEIDEMVPPPSAEEALLRWLHDNRLFAAAGPAADDEEDVPDAVARWLPVPRSCPCPFTAAHAELCTAIASLPLRSGAFGVAVAHLVRCVAGRIQPHAPLHTAAGAPAAAAVDASASLAWTCPGCAAHMLAAVCKECARGGSPSSTARLASLATEIIEAGVVHTGVLEFIAGHVTGGGGHGTHTGTAKNVACAVLLIVLTNAHTGAGAEFWSVGPSAPGLPPGQSHHGAWSAAASVLAAFPAFAREVLSAVTAEPQTSAQAASHHPAPLEQLRLAASVAACQLSSELLCAPPSAIRKADPGRRLFASTLARESADHLWPPPSRSHHHPMADAYGYHDAALEADVDHAPSATTALCSVLHAISRAVNAFGGIGQVATTAQPATAAAGLIPRAVLLNATAAIVDVTCHVVSTCNHTARSAVRRKELCAVARGLVALPASAGIGEELFDKADRLARVLLSLATRVPSDEPSQRHGDGGQCDDALLLAAIAVTDRAACSRLLSLVKGHRVAADGSGNMPSTLVTLPPRRNEGPMRSSGAAPTTSCGATDLMRDAQSASWANFCAETAASWTRRHQRHPH